MATPQDIIDDAREYVGDLAYSAEQALSFAGQWAENSVNNAIDYLNNPFQIEGITKLEPASIPEAPNLNLIELQLDPIPADMEQLQPIPTYAPQQVPSFDLQAPEFIEPVKPSQLSDFVGTPPEPEFPDIPDSPSGLNDPLPDVSFGAHAMPVMQAMSMPSRPNAPPVFDVSAPDDLAGDFSGNIDKYTTRGETLANAYVDGMMAKFAPNHKDGMAALEAKLTEFMAGGTGIPSEVEDAIYARGRARNDEEAKRMQDATFLDVAARGFTLPTGALVSLLSKARQESAANSNKTNNEIMIQQADLEQKNIQFAISTSAALRTTVLGLTNSWLQGLVSLNGQALDAAKSVMGAVIEAYNTSVKAYSMQLEGWRAEVALFDGLLKFELGKVEVFRAEVQRLEAEYSADQMQIDLVKAEISRRTALADLYKSQVESVIAKADMEKKKVDVFQMQVQAYAAQTQAKQAEWQGFSAQVSGYTARAQVYNAQASAFSSRVQAFKADIDAKTSEIDAVIKQNQGIVESYRAKMQAYLASVQAESASNSANIETQRQKATIFKAQVDENLAKYQSDIVYYKAEADRILEEARLDFSAKAKQAELKLSGAKITSDVFREIGTIQGNMAQAALSGMNTLAASTETI